MCLPKQGLVQTECFCSLKYTLYPARNELSVGGGVTESAPHIYRMTTPKLGMITLYLCQASQNFGGGIAHHPSPAGTIHVPTYSVTAFYLKMWKVNEHSLIFILQCLTIVKKFRL